MTSFVVHLGLSKTGSTALQRALADHAPALAERGLWYPTTPPFVLADRRVPKHQPVVRLVRDDDAAGIAAWVDRLAAETPAGVDTIVLSAEGLWRQSVRHRASVELALQTLRAAGPTRGVVVTRDLVDLQASLYKQAVRNPPTDEGMGTGQTMPEWLARPDIDPLWDVPSFVATAGTSLGRPLDVIDYGPDVVARAWDVVTEGRLDVPHEILSSRPVHPSLDDDAAELLRLVNPTLAGHASRTAVIRALTPRRARRPLPPAIRAPEVQVALARVDVESVQPACGAFRPTQAGVARWRDRVLDLLDT